MVCVAGTGIKDLGEFSKLETSSSLRHFLILCFYAFLVVKGYELMNLALA